MNVEEVQWVDHALAIRRRRKGGPVGSDEEEDSDAETLVGTEGELAALNRNVEPEEAVFSCDNCEGVFRTNTGNARGGKFCAGPCERQFCEACVKTSLDVRRHRDGKGRTILSEVRPIRIIRIRPIRI